MSALRAPVVAGVAGGVGTSTVAAALRGRDAERDVERADIVVCHLTGDSLRKVARLAETLPAGARPVLAVTAAPGAARGPLAVRLRLLEPRFAGVVVLPHVGAWRELADPLAEAAVVLGKPAERLSRPLRGYADGLRALAAAVAASGRLAAPVPAAASGRPAAPVPAADHPHARTSGAEPAGPRSAYVPGGGAGVPGTPSAPAPAAAPAARAPRLWPGLTGVEHRPRALHPSVALADDVEIEAGPSEPEPHNVVPLRRPAAAGLLAVGADR